MLKKRERLTKKQFDRFFSSGRRYHSPLFTVVHTPGDDFHGAIVVGKKVFKKAVDRNKLRRRLYNILYRSQCDGGMKGVYIILTKPQAAKASFSELKTTLTELLHKIKS